MSPVRLHIFFAGTGRGPYTAPNYGCKFVEFSKHCEGAYKAWDTARQDRLAAADVVTVAKSGLQGMALEKKNQSLKRAREKAASVPTAKKERQSIRLDDR